MRVIVTGGDGFIGWPTALRLSAQGHDVLILDNFMRRRLARSLTPIVPLPERTRRWEELFGKYIRHACMDVADCEQLLALLNTFTPEAIVHLATQPSAPYSMRDMAGQMETVRNNVLATTSVLSAVVAAKLYPRIVHIGTMGVYGYGVGGIIPEGYATAEIDGVEREILCPTDPGSLYHATKVCDQTLFAFYAKNYGLQITDLHQGVVWGTQTEETREDDILINRFDYDGDFGTVLNRFLMQAAIGHPLTVYGTGGQTRAFININDTVRCLELALKFPPQRGDPVQIMNQMTEVHRVRDLAKAVAKMTGAKISFVDNPRKEAAENDLRARHKKLHYLGLEDPVLLKDGLLHETHDIALRFKHLADSSKIICNARWVA